MIKQGILLCGHGSRTPQGTAHFEQFAGQFQAAHPETLVAWGYLELSSPRFEQAIEKLYQQGARAITAIPVFLFTGVHIQHDIPTQLQQIASKYTDLEIKIAHHIGVCDSLIDLAIQLIQNGKQENHQLHHLLVVGVGASLSEANSDILQIAETIARQLSFGSHSVAYTSPVAKPTINQAFSSTIAQDTIIILPLILFAGTYLDKIQLTANQFAEQTNKNIIITNTLSSHPLLLEILNQRFIQANIETCNLDGSQMMGLDCCGAHTEN